jgi:hypothetical protein
MAAAGGVFFLLYVVFAAKPLAASLSLEPAWVVDTASAAGTPASGDSALIPFRLGQSMGYFTPDGVIHSLSTYSFAAAISAQYQAAFLPGAAETAFYTPDGRQAGVIRESGFPFFEDDRIFLFRPGGAAVSQLSETGAVLWTYEGYTPITAFASSPAAAAAGYADGIVRVLFPDGSAHEIAPEGSGFPVILGVDIAPDGRLVASVSGINGQRFTLTRMEGGVNKVIAHRYLQKETREQTLVKFNAAGDCVYYNPRDALCVFDCRRDSFTEIPVDGVVIDVQEMPGGDFVFVLSKKQREYTVWVLEKMSKPAGSFSFEADSAFIRTSPGALYVGKNTTISKINVSRR